MNYATQQDMVDRFAEVELVQLTDSTNSGAIDAAVLGRALDDADAEIDGYLAGRYALPLTTVPKILVGYACDIARYRLYDDRATEHVAKRYDDAVRYLRMVAEGKVGLGLSSASEAAAPAGGPAISAPARVFSHDTLKDY